MSGRTLFAPEVVQSSAMDCGPAALKCLAQGFGIEVSYERLREACHTDIDGTSIDAVEDAAGFLGLEAEQVLIPPDHLGLPEARSLPAVVVVANALGVTHFVVVWQRVGRWLQVMDPAVGRRWTTFAALRRELYLHAVEVEAGAWREWAGSADFVGPLAARMRRLGLGAGLAAELVGRAVTAPGWRPLAALDAATRMAQVLVAERALRRGADASALLEAVVAAPTAAGERLPIPEQFWSVRPGVKPSPPRQADDGDPLEPLAVAGIVLVRVLGRKAETATQRESTGQSDGSGSRPALLAVFTPQVRALRELWRATVSGERARLGVLAAAIPLAAAAAVLEVVFFRGLLDLGARLSLPEQRILWLGLLLLFLAIFLALELTTVRTVLALARKLETLLRVRLLERIPRLGERYFRSRLSSDMAERCHSVHKLRLFPELLGGAARVVLQIALTILALAWLAPEVAHLAALAGLLSVGIPLAAQPILRERDLRMRTHAGALARFTLDSLLGLVPVRTHAAERAVRREHEALLCEWVRSSYELERAVLGVEVLHAFAGYGAAIAIVFRHVSTGGGAGTVLLLAFWAVLVQMLGQQLVVMGRQLPGLRSAAGRLLEPLAATPEERQAAQPSGQRPAAAGVAVRLEGVGVVAAGQEILQGIDLELWPGERVAVVGASGAGKSTLVGLLLGWHRPASGLLWLDGREAGEAEIAALREETAWVDPGVRLWNRTLLHNLLYGSPAGAVARLGSVTRAAMVRDLLEGLPEGLQTVLGEGGALVSGGEGQRVRLARGMTRRDARLVLLDEPFRGLDRETRMELTARARRWWSGATMLVVTHDVATAAQFDRVVVMADGRLVEQGEPATLLAADSRFAHLLEQERAVRQRLVEGEGWRQLWMVDGRLVEAPGPDPAPLAMAWKVREERCVS